MTAEELKFKLEAEAKFTVQPPFPLLDIKFENGNIYNENGVWGEYRILEDNQPKHFRIIIENILLNGVPFEPLDKFEDIIIEIENDPEFPIYVNRSNRRERRNIVLKAIEKI